MIEHAKFTYSLLGKAFEKQTKTIKKQGEKQIDGLKTFKPLKPKETKPIEYDNYVLTGLAKIRESLEPIDFNDLTYKFKGSENAQINFIKFKGPNHIFKRIHDGDIEGDGDT